MQTDLMDCRHGFMIIQSAVGDFRCDSGSSHTAKYHERELERAR
jgi:hypothetical protein